MKKREPTEYIIQPKGWRKRYKCHKNKGPHTFVVVYAQSCDWSYMKGDRVFPLYNMFVHHECTACGKQHLEVIK